MTAWDVLLKCGICELPVDLRKVCKGLGIGLFSYSQGYSIIQKLGLVHHTIGADGFLFQADGVSIAFYNQQQPLTRRNFTIAHEIGHFALGHACIDGAVRREPGNKNDPEEKEANLFSSMLLAPTCVLRGMKVDSAYSIENLCAISYQAANISWDKLQRLCSLDDAYMAERGYSYFFRSSTEWKVYKQFEPFIRNHLANHQISLRR